MKPNEPLGETALGPAITHKAGGGDMVLSKRREELFPFEFAGYVRRQCLKITAVSLEAVAVNLSGVQCEMLSPNDS
ncbi:hypothetical protein [Pedosphaera parvula]|nr:hypothetical protein [Pedosphaera parvula]